MIFFPLLDSSKKKKSLWLYSMFPPTKQKFLSQKKKKVFNITLFSFAELSNKIILIDLNSTKETQYEMSLYFRDCPL